MLFRVQWSIDIEADDAKSAAREAQEIQRDTDSIATVFEVAPWGDTKGHFPNDPVWEEVDLAKDRD